MIRNGWFINSDGLVFILINGSAYEVDASESPLKELPPGSYSDDEARAAIRVPEGKRGLLAHELFKVRVWLGLQGIKA